MPLRTHTICINLENTGGFMQTHIHTLRDSTVGHRILFQHISIKPNLEVAQFWRKLIMHVFSWDNMSLLVSCWIWLVAGVLLTCVLLLKVQARSVAAHVGWQVTLLMSAFFRGYSATGLERFSASARWHEISAVTPRWEGGDSIKNSADTCSRRLLLLSRHQQSHFHWIVFQRHLFCLLYLVLHFPFPSFFCDKNSWQAKFKDFVIKYRYPHTLAYHSYVVLSIHCCITVKYLLGLPPLLPFSPLVRMRKFCPPSLLYCLTLGGHGSPTSINNTDNWCLDSNSSG